MHAVDLPNKHVPIGARLMWAAALSLCQTAARLYRAARVMERNESPEDERHYAQALLVGYGKLD
jgi:hypothetical protein